MSKHTRARPTQRTLPAPPPVESNHRRGDTATAPRPTAKPPGKLGDANSQASPWLPAAPPRRLSSEEQFQTIQGRAFYLWEQAGRPDGDAPRERFWLLAEREIVVPLPDA